MFMIGQMVKMMIYQTDGIYHIIYDTSIQKHVIGNIPSNAKTQVA